MPQTALCEKPEKASIDRPMEESLKNFDDLGNLIAFLYALTKA